DPSFLVNFRLSKPNELQNRLGDLPELTNFSGLSVICVGSYGRLEASEYSDIDLFFLIDGEKKDVTEPRTRSLGMFGKVIDVATKMNFPKFSNDCEYLKLLYSKDILAHLGGPTDDHENYFTARMLLLLESRCLYGQKTLDAIVSNIIESYFRDYPDHPQTFQPIFLLNDICRFWKTLLLNYEHKRNVRTADDDKKKIRQKVRNFKLKYSRLTTCYASIAALGSHRVPITVGHVHDLMKLSPRQRVQSIPKRIPAVEAAVNEVLNDYEWFLTMTGLPTDALEDQFVDKQKRTEMFKRANEYGDKMFKLLVEIDKTDSQHSFLRYVVI
ncbi:MAG: nucleotidyltransferase domain-containing protein, partial [Syntrophobacteraceae bacterium]